MPIFAYRCERCGFQKDVLQKRSDAPLTTCPSCDQEAFSKQLTAPAFQLKGSGWYVTDFRDKAPAKAGEAKEGASAPAEAAAAPSAAPAPSSAPAPTSSTPAPAPTSSAGTKAA